jgi:hypothetical protein
MKLGGRRRLTHLIVLIAVVVAALVGVPYACDVVAGNSRIRIYGRVTDDEGHPIEGVTITAEISANRRGSVPVMWADNSYRFTLTAETDREGRFVVKGMGTYLRIMDIKRQGYILPAKQPPSQYSFGGSTHEGPTGRSSGTSANFRMWKLRGEFMVEQKGQRYSIPMDGKVEVGLSDVVGIKIQVRVHDGGQSVTVEPVNGGLQAASDDFHFLAPPDGYAPTGVYELGSSKGVTGPFYFTAHNGAIYGIANISIMYTRLNEGFLYVNFRANVHGQRTLETDHITVEVE